MSAVLTPDVIRSEPPQSPTPALVIAPPYLSGVMRAGAEDFGGLGGHLVGDEDFGHVSFIFRHPGESRDPMLGRRGINGDWVPAFAGMTTYAAAAALAVTWACAQSSHGPSASMSLVSTAEPHQIRRPGGASR